MQARRRQPIIGRDAELRWGTSGTGRSLFERGTSENWSAAQGGIEGKESDRGHQQYPGQTDARIPGGHLGREGKIRYKTVKEPLSYHSQQAEAD